MGSGDCIYWAYYHLIDGEWQYSNRGVTSYTVKSGDVEVWAWGPGTVGAGGVTPPVRSFAEVCAAPTATATASATTTATPSHTAAPTKTSTATRTPTDTPTPTATATANPTATPASSVSPIPTQKRAPTATPIASPTPGATRTAPATMALHTVTPLPTRWTRPTATPGALALASVESGQRASRGAAAGGTDTLQYLGFGALALTLFGSLVVFRRGGL